VWEFPLIGDYCSFVDACMGLYTTESSGFKEDRSLQSSKTEAMKKMAVILKKAKLSL
jgi:hypothetical protein